MNPVPASALLLTVDKKTAGFKIPLLVFSLKNMCLSTVTDHHSDLHFLFKSACKSSGEGYRGAEKKREYI